MLDLDFLERLKGGGSNAERVEMLRSALAEFGYQNIHYGIARIGPVPAADESIEVNTHDPEVARYFREHHLQRTEYGVLQCLAGRKDPILWSEVHRLEADGRLPKPVGRTQRLLRDFGYGYGVTLSLPVPKPLHSGIGLSADPSLSMREHDRVFKASEARILSLIDTFHATMDRRAMAIDAYGLTKRELEALKWLADGLREKDIARKLGISERTVEKQIASARRRLEAATSTQAVVKAFMFGILSW